MVWQEGTRFSRNKEDIVERDVNPGANSGIIIFLWTDQNSLVDAICCNRCCVVDSHCTMTMSVRIMT